MNEQELTLNLSRTEDGLRVGLSIVSIIAILQLVVQYLPTIMEIIEKIKELWTTDPTPGPIVSK